MKLGLFTIGLILKRGTDAKNYVGPSYGQFFNKN